MEKLALVLGGGAARGWAHIGIIRALSEKGISPDIVTGTSIGSLVGAIYSSDQMTALEETALSLDWKDILKFSMEFKMPRTGLIDGRKICDLIDQHLSFTHIEDMPIPFACVATNLETGLPYVLKEGNLIEAIRASISIPGMFTPVYYNKSVLVDGGLVNPLPVDVAKEMGATKIIAVDINHRRLDRPRKTPPRNLVDDMKKLGDKHVDKYRSPFTEKLRAKIDKISPENFGPFKEWIAPDPIPNIFEVIMDSVIIMETQVTERNLVFHKPDVLICPEVQMIEPLEFNRAEEAIAAGYIAALESMDEISALINS